MNFEKYNQIFMLNIGLVYIIKNGITTALFESLDF